MIKYNNIILYLILHKSKLFIIYFHIHVFISEMYNGKIAGHLGMLTVLMHHLQIKLLKNISQFKTINGIIIGKSIFKYN